MAIGWTTALAAGFDAATGWFNSQKEKTKAKTKAKVTEYKATARERIKTVRQAQKTERQRIDAQAGLKRELIKKPLKWMRRAGFTILFAPLVIGAAMIAVEYLMAFFTGQPATPNFEPLRLFWDQVVDGTPPWWVDSIRQVFAFLWAGGEVTNLCGEAGGAVMDHWKAQKSNETERERQRRKAEREARNREREARGEQPLNEDPEDDDREIADVPKAPGRMR